jgi:hypothetical protein
MLVVTRVMHVDIVVTNSIPLFPIVSYLFTSNYEHIVDIISKKIFFVMFDTSKIINDLLVVLTSKINLGLLID